MSSIAARCPVTLIWHSSMSCELCGERSVLCRICHSCTINYWFLSQSCNYVWEIHTSWFFIVGIKLDDPTRTFEVTATCMRASLETTCNCKHFIFPSFSISFLLQFSFTSDHMLITASDRDGGSWEFLFLFSPERSILTWRIMMKDSRFARHVSYSNGTFL